MARCQDYNRTSAPKQNLEPPRQVRIFWVPPAQVGPRKVSSPPLAAASAITILASSGFHCFHAAVEATRGKNSSIVGRRRQVSPTPALPCCLCHLPPSSHPLASTARWQRHVSPPPLLPAASAVCHHLGHKDCGSSREGGLPAAVVLLLVFCISSSGSCQMQGRW